MDNAKKRLNDIGSAMVGVGSKVAGVGSAIAASLGAAGVAFAAAGDKLDKMSARTGMSVEQLSALKFAAEQSGASLDDVERAARGMMRQGLDPKNFEQVAQSIGSIEDAGLRGKEAMRVFGRSGTMLLPMLENMSSLKREAEELGIVMSTEDATAAAELTDAMNRVRQTMNAVVQQIGASIAPVMTELANGMAKAAGQVTAFIKANRELIVRVAKTAIAVAGIGTAIVAAGFALKGMALLIGLVMSPVGLLVVGLVAAGAAFYRFSNVGKAAIGGFAQKAGEVLKSLRETFETTFGGIRDAIAAGDLALAGQIAMTGLRLVMTQGVEQLAKTIGGKFGDIVAKFGGQIASGDFAGAWNTVVLGMTDIWASFANGLTNVFADAASGVINIWKKTVDKLTNMILSKAAEGGAFGKFFEQISGVNVQKEMERERNLQAQAEAMGLGSKSDPLFDDIRNGTFSDPGTQAAVDDLQSKLDGIKKSSQDATIAAMQALDQNVGGAADAVSDDVKRLQGELDTLRQRAKTAREEAKQRAEEEEKAGIGFGGMGGGAKASIATFSAAAAVAMSQGGGRDPVVRKQEEQIGIMKKGNDLMQNLIGRVDGMGMHHA